MSIKNVLQSLTSTSRRPTRRSPSASRLCLEALEDRLLPSFSPAVIYPAGADPRAVVAADFNGDSRLDLAVSNGGSHSVNVLLGNGDGSFQAPLASSAGQYTGGLLAGDLNSDAKIDLVSSGGPLVVLRGTGAGAFLTPTSVALPSQTPPGYTGPPLGQAASAGALGDINADGMLDLVAKGVTAYPVVIYYQEDGNPVYEYHYDTYVNVLLGSGNATFVPAAAYRISNPGAGFYLRDFNGDGRLDVATDWQLLLGNGDGTLQAPVQSYVETYEGGTVGDVNVDGKLDIVKAVGYLTQVKLGYGNGSFAPPINSNLGTPPDNCFSSVTLGDFDGDGFPDLAVVAPDYSYYSEYDDTEYNFPGFVAVAHNDGAWTLSAPPAPTIRIGAVTVIEGHTGTRAANFTVTLSAASGQPVTVAYTTANGASTAGNDYHAAAGTLTIPAGQTTGTIAVLVKGDRLGEANETFFVNLNSPTNATLSDGQGVGTIVDDEPRISIGDVSKKEGKKNQSTLFTFTVTLSVAYDQAVTMSFKTVDGTAKTSDADYVAKTGTLTFAPGETTKTITIEVQGDSKKEADETFYLDLFSNSDNSLFTKKRGIGTILNDD